MNQTITLNEHEARRAGLSATSFTREHVYGCVEGFSYEVIAYRTDDARRTRKPFECTWAAKRPGMRAGWSQWRARFATEDAALAFAAEKIVACREWAARRIQEAA